MFDARYCADLIRNDRFLEDRPILISPLIVRPEDVDILSQRGRAWVITKKNLGQFGVATKTKVILTLPCLSQDTPILEPVIPTLSPLSWLDRRNLEKRYCLILSYRLSFPNNCLEKIAAGLLGQTIHIREN